MKITALEIDGYGVWSGLRIEKLADGAQRALRPERGRQDHAAAVHPLDALRLLAAAAAVSAAGPRRAARRVIEWPVRTAASRSAATTIRWPTARPASR